jgi:hypothetical protein
MEQWLACIIVRSQVQTVQKDMTSSLGAREPASSEFQGLATQAQPLGPWDPGVSLPAPEMLRLGN